MLRKEIFCLAPWVQQVIDPDGKVGICCLSTHFSPIGNIVTSSLHNVLQFSTQLQEFKSDFLNLSDADICSKRTYCQECVRKHLTGNTQREQIQEQAKNAGAKITEDSKTVILEIRPNTTCNLSCIACCEYNSSRWQKLKGSTSKDRITEEKLEELFCHIRRNSRNLYRVHIIGGETLCSKNIFFDMLKYIQHPEQVYISFNTNMTIPFDQDLVDLLKVFKGVYIGVSIDAIGELNDIIRPPSNWNHIENNFRSLFEKVIGSNITIELYPTWQVFNVLHFPRIVEFSEEIKRFYNGKKDLGVFLNNRVIDPEALSLKYLNSKNKDKVTELFLEKLQKVKISDKNRVKLKAGFEAAIGGTGKENNSIIFTNYLNFLTEFLKKDYTALFKRHNPDLAFLCE